MKPPSWHPLYRGFEISSFTIAKCKFPSNPETFVKDQEGTYHKWSMTARAPRRIVLWRLLMDEARSSRMIPETKKVQISEGQSCNRLIVNHGSSLQRPECSWSVRYLLSKFEAYKQFLITATWQNSWPNQTPLLRLSKTRIKFRNACLYVGAPPPNISRP